MSSNFSLNDLGIGLTMPIKLKNIIERPRTGQPLAFNKLAEILSSNFLKKKQSNKENRCEKSQKHTFIIRESKNMRICSLKNSHV